MNEADYLKDRVDDQYNWLNNKATRNKNLYKRIRAGELILAALIPFLVAFIPEEGCIVICMKIAVGLLGIMVSILAGLQTLNKYQELWVQYRGQAEALLREKLLYLTRADKYEQGDDAAFRLFVQEVERILSNELMQWKTLMMRTEDKEKPKTDKQEA
jgi:hypothetical protein